MIQPTTAYMIAQGVYDDYRILAVFTEQHGEQEFADHHNLTTQRYTHDDRAHVEEIDPVRTGWRRPPTQTLDGEIVNTTSEAHAIGHREEVR